MEFGDWLATNWFNALSAAGVVGSLWFTAVSLRSASGPEGDGHQWQTTRQPEGHSDVPEQLGIPAAFFGL